MIRAVKKPNALLTTSRSEMLFNRWLIPVQKLS
jgi:hypothetical protein